MTSCITVARAPQRAAHKPVLRLAVGFFTGTEEGQSVDSKQGESSPDVRWAFTDLGEEPEDDADKGFTVWCLASS